MNEPPIPTLDALRAIQASIKDAMDGNTLTSVNEAMKIVEESIDEDLQKQLRDAWKHVFAVIRKHYPDDLDHKIRRR